MTTLDEAIEKLAGHGGYGWLIDSKSAFWTVKQVVDALATGGRSVSVSTVTGWFRGLPHTQGHVGKQGLIASRNDLIIMFADQMINK